MQASPKFIFEDGFFLYHGGVNRNELHSNAAYQIAISSTNDIHIYDNEAQETVGNMVLVKPLVKHKIICDGSVSLIYLSPKLNWALSFLKNIDISNNITALDDNLLPFKKTDSLEMIAAALKNEASTPKIELDPRLSAAIQDLSSNLANASILQTAQRCNLSRSRLRAIARKQIGMPLSTWLTWKKIVEANKALATGASLSEAAFNGGFSDQAHFTRTMKRMFGVTPTHALKVYN